ncbi:MAG: hypothetical protein LW635_10615 [Microcystis sp. 53598_E5]|nr:hypothetical protein [Microcystis sp. 53598_E5]
MERYADPVTLDDLIRLRKENERYLQTIDRYSKALHSIIDCVENTNDDAQKLADIWEIAVTGLGIRPDYL